MNKAVLFAGGAAFLTLALAGEPPAVQWTGTFGGLGEAYGECVQQTSDDGYVMAGWTIGDTGYTRFYLAKTDPQGNAEWEKSFRGAGSIMASSVLQTADGGYVVAGRGFLAPNGPGNACLLKTDSLGDLEWLKSLTDEDSMWTDGCSVVQAQDHGFVVAALSPPSNSGLVLIRTDSMGNREWRRQYYADWPEYYTRVRVEVQQTTDGGYIIASKTLVKTDSLGNQQWVRTYAGISRAHSVVQTADGGYAATGPGDTLQGRDKRQISLLKTDEAGNQQWVEKYGESYSSVGNWVEQTTDGGYVIAGKVDSRARIVRASPTGHEDWSIAPSGQGSSAQCIRQTHDGGYIITGGCYDKPSNKEYLFLMKLAPEQ